MIQWIQAEALEWGLNFPVSFKVLAKKSEEAQWGLGGTEREERARSAGGGNWPQPGEDDSPTGPPGSAAALLGRMNHWAQPNSRRSERSLRTCPPHLEPVNPEFSPTPSLPGSVPLGAP